jgi:hypothetical protein
MQVWGVIRRSNPQGGAKLVELPVQLPIKYELAINVKTAKALLATADEVVE